VYTGHGKNTFDETKFRLAYLARVEVLPLGLYDDSVEADFERSGPRLGIGVSVYHTTDAPRDRGSVGALPADGGTTDINGFSADANFKVAGFSATTEFFYRHGDRNAGGAITPATVGVVAGAPAVVPAAPVGLAAARDGIGWYLQGGYLIPRMPLEIVARYGMIKGREGTLDHDGLRDSHEVGGGVGYYFARNALKLQADYLRSQETTSPKGSGSKVMKNDDFIRLQLQIAL
jgi:hypothetical protein